MIKNTPFFNNLNDKTGARNYYSLSYDFSKSEFYVSLTKRLGEEIEEASIGLADFVREHPEEEVSALHHLINTMMSV